MKLAKGKLIIMLVLLKNLDQTEEAMDKQEIPLNRVHKEILPTRGEGERVKEQEQLQENQTNNFLPEILFWGNYEEVSAVYREEQELAF